MDARIGNKGTSVSISKTGNSATLQFHSKAALEDFVHAGIKLLARCTVEDFPGTSLNTVARTGEYWFARKAR